jgi:hypothetical protein
MVDHDKQEEAANHNGRKYHDDSFHTCPLDDRWSNAKAPRTPLVTFVFRWRLEPKIGEVFVADLGTGRRIRRTFYL